MTHIDDPQTQKANRDYIRQSMDTPLLDKEREFALATRWQKQGDEKALHMLINAYARLVIAIAARFKHYGLPMGDLIQEGHVGLIQAANRFDTARDVRFSTYATWWIKAAIQDYVLRNWSIVRTGTTSAQKSLFFNLRRLRTQIENTDERQSEHGGLDNAARLKIAKDLGVRLEDVKEMEGRMLSGGDQSLNATIGADGETEFQSLLSDSGPNPEEILVATKDAAARSKWLNEALKGLAPREQTILRERHLTYEPVTLEELGKELGISKERVRQIEHGAMQKLKISMMSHVTDARELF